MTFILLFLFIIFIVAPLASAMYRIWSFRRRMHRFMEDPFGQAGSGHTSGAYGQQQRRRYRERQGKKIPHDVGEYVPFTEYEATADAAPAGSSGHKIRTESQITDVEWVDIEK